MSRRVLSRRGVSVPLALLLLAVPMIATADDEPTEAVATEHVEVVATRVPEDVMPVPASVTIVTGDQMAARGVTDLAGALSLATGIAIAPGGDDGPAGSVPEFWGLREFDAFLLVVDGVPWGGAFNPDLPTLDLVDVDRIEILRGAAPVTFGPTSFVGVINVIHRAPDSKVSETRLFGGNHSSGGAAVAVALPPNGAWTQRVIADFERHGLADRDAGWDRGHVLYRGGTDTSLGRFDLDFDATLLRQNPTSPHPREGKELSDAFPLDGNVNPRDAKLDRDRFHLILGWEKPTTGDARWKSTLSLSHTEDDIVRGFLEGVDEDPAPAGGYRQDRKLTDVYFDLHWSGHVASNVLVVAGIDHLYGKGEQESENFDYLVGLDGSGRPYSEDQPVQEATRLDDERNFSGLYARSEWMPREWLRLEAGARLSYVKEMREGELVDGGVDRRAEGEEEGGEGELSKTRLSGVVGASARLWQSGIDSAWAYADWRDTFKPAAIDFGPEAESDLLDPETARSWEVGVKGRFLNGRVEADLSGFQMDFENLVISTVVDGRPALANAGNERFRGVEAEVSVLLDDALRLHGSYAWHDAVFRDALVTFDGVPTELSGNRLEMSPKHMGALGISWAPKLGLQATASAHYVGDRYMDKRNRALADSYTTWSAGLGWRFESWEVRVDGQNLSDERPPVAESELGDAQYYRLPARSVTGTIIAKF